MVAVESTVMLNGASTSTSSLAPGTTPPGQGASGTVDDQLPLPVAVMSVARDTKQTRNATAGATRQRSFFVFIFASGNDLGTERSDKSNALLQTIGSRCVL